MSKVILDLCGGTGAWSAPYERAGYEVHVVDPAVGTGDVRLFKWTGKPVHGVLAAPPCTHLAVSGARWWRSKGEAPLLESLSVVDACLRIAVAARPKWWALENPAGRLRRYLGPPRLTFHPYHFGDPWKKYTCLWGNFTPPTERRVEPQLGRNKWDTLFNCLSPKPARPQLQRLVEAGFLRPDWEQAFTDWPTRQQLRSITPPSFAQAFFEANP